MAVEAIADGKSADADRIGLYCLRSRGALVKVAGVSSHPPRQFVSLWTPLPTISADETIRDDNTMPDSIGSSHPLIGSTSSRLLARARSCDQDAWRRLVGLYGRLVLYWCAQAGLQRADRRDVFQEVFLAVAKYLEHFRGDRPKDTFRGWLRRVTQSKIVDYYRRHARQPTVTGGSEAYHTLLGIHEVDIGHEGDAGNLTESSLLVRQAMKRVREEFEDRTWQAFLRTAVDGICGAVVAEELGMTPVAIRQAKSRVLRRLRYELRGLID